MLRNKSADSEQIMLDSYMAECTTTDPYINHSMENHRTITLKLSGTIVVRHTQ